MVVISIHQDHRSILIDCIDASEELDPLSAVFELEEETEATENTEDDQENEMDPDRQEQGRTTPRPFSGEYGLLSRRFEY